MSTQQRKRTSAGEARARLKAARQAVPPPVDRDEDDAQAALAAVPQQTAADTAQGVHPAAADFTAFTGAGPAEPAPLPQPYTAPAQHEQAVAVREPELPAPAPAASAERASHHQRGTGIDVPPDLHERVQREARTRSRSGQVVTQTEILLQAFETVYERLPELVARHRTRHQTSSPLFGTRDVHVAEKTGAMKRLQVRPTYDQHHRLHALAEHFDLSLAVLTRIVLHAYFHPQEDSSTGT